MFAPSFFALTKDADRLPVVINANAVRSVDAIDGATAITFFDGGAVVVAETPGAVLGLMGRSDLAAVFAAPVRGHVPHVAR